MSHCHFVNNISHIDCPGIKPLLFYPEEAASTFQDVATYLKSNRMHPKRQSRSFLFYYCNLYSCLTHQCHTRCIHTHSSHAKHNAKGLRGPCNNIKSDNSTFYVKEIVAILTSNENIYLVLFQKLQSLRIPVYLVWTFDLLTELSQIK